VIHLEHKITLAYSNALKNRASPISHNWVLSVRVQVGVGGVLTGTLDLQDDQRAAGLSPARRVGTSSWTDTLTREGLCASLI
jgi:hypothetical protein